MRNVNRRTEIVPVFRIHPKPKDLLVRGGDFYAVWDEAAGQWSTDEGTVVEFVDKMLDEYIDKNHIPRDQVSIKYMWNSSTGTIDAWHKYVQKQCRDFYKPLDEELIFANTTPTRELYSSKRLPYSLAEGKTDAWDRLVGVLYSEEEKEKIEWCIGSIVAGDSKHIQKFAVFYGMGGTGKSTVLNIINKLFDGYCAAFVAKDLASTSNAFALEAFKSNPLVAIEHDGDLSRIEDNTRLNSLISHETMMVNEKFKAQYATAFKAFLFIGTNKPVKITDSKSGIIRRLIDIRPSGERVSQTEYNKLMKLIDFELGAIAYKCMQFYKENKYKYDGYLPINMMESTNDIFNFLIDSHSKIVANNNEISLNTAWQMWKEYTEESRISNAMPKRIFKEELKDYFLSFEDNVYRYIKDSKLRPPSNRFEKEEVKEDEPTEEDMLEQLGLRKQHSLLDDILAEDPAQYATNDESEKPKKAWDSVKTKLKDIDTNKVHYVNIQDENHIIFDLDKKVNGEKSLEANLKMALTLPPTYTEISKGGSGLHMHYIYVGDVSELSRLYDDNVEVKIFKGNQALRRKLTLCNDTPIATLTSGVKKKEKKKVIDENKLENERHLINIINKNLDKGIHDNTAESINFIVDSIEKAYESGIEYSIPDDLKNDIFAFASSATNSADRNLKLLRTVHWKSSDLHVLDPSMIVSTKVLSTEEIPIVFFDIEIFPNYFIVCAKFKGQDDVWSLVNPTPREIESLCHYRLIGFNNREYDNHMLYACMLGYTVEELYNLSYGLINDKDHNFKFPDAFNLSYTDVYDFASAGNKMSLKKWEIKLGITHHENAYPWDKPLPNKKALEEVIEYCKDDVRATEAVFDHLASDFTARTILADLAGGTVNDKTNALTTKFIFGNNKKPQSEFYYRDLSKPVYESDMDPESIKLLKEWFPDMMAEPHGEAKSILPYFDGYQFDGFKSTYREKLASEGGYAKGYPGYYINVALLDITSMHPHSAMAEMIFGPRFTKAFHDIVYGRVNIKHEAWDVMNTYLDGKLMPYIDKVIAGEMNSGDLADALKTAINSVYGLTAAKFPNAFRDPRNTDNIVAKRGSLFMIELEYQLQKRGVTVVHIKTDSIKIANCTPEDIEFVMNFGKRYGYFFEHEATYDKMVIVNDAVYIAKYATCEKCNTMYGYSPSKQKKGEGHWTATGTQFQVPYVFKTLFSKEEILFEDMCETFSTAKGAINIDFNEDLVDVATLENDFKKFLTWKAKHFDERTEEEWAISEKKFTDIIDTGHNYTFVGRVGQFTPVKDGVGGGVLYRADGGKYYALSGSKGYRWMESDIVKSSGLEESIDRSYYRHLVDEAVEAIEQYVPIDEFTSDDPIPMPNGTQKCSNCRNCEHYYEVDGVCDCNKLEPYIDTWADNNDLTVLPF